MFVDQKTNKDDSHSYSIAFLYDQQVENLQLMTYRTVINAKSKIGVIDILTKSAHFVLVPLAVS